MTNVSLKCPQKAIIFARVSSSNQEAGYSLDAQVSRLQNYCKQNNFEVVKEFQSVSNRNKFLEAIEFVKNSQEKIILVINSIDRLHRNLEDLVLIHELICHDKIEIYCIENNYIINRNSQSKILFQFHALLAFSETYNSSKNNKQSIKSKLKIK